MEANSEESFMVFSKKKFEFRGSSAAKNNNKL